MIRHALALLMTAAATVAAQPLVRLDHVPVAVHDLEQAQATYQGLGYAIKPGRPHANGLRNAHIKFANGAGLELITAPQPATPDANELAAHYAALLRDGEGPAYLTLHADDTAQAAAALRAAGLAHHIDAHGLTLDEPQLDWVFFAGDNRSPTDRPEHFAHTNGATVLREVWVATDTSAPLARLLTALGAHPRLETRRQPVAVQATVFDLADGGRVVVVPARHRLLPGRPVIGVVFGARPGPTTWYAPARTHGLWLGLGP